MLAVVCFSVMVDGWCGHLDWELVQCVKALAFEEPWCPAKFCSLCILITVYYILYKMAV